MTIPSAMPSGIKQREEFEGVRLSWPLPSMMEGPVRYVFAAFFLFGTVTWGAGIVAATREFLVSPRFAMTVWIAGWTLGGAWLPLVLWGLVRRRSESILLGPESLTYDPGWNMFSPGTLGAFLTSRWSELRPRPVTVRKLDFVPELAEGYLTFEAAGNRFVMGTGLDDADRQWLVDALENWRAR